MLSRLKSMTTVTLVLVAAVAVTTKRRRAPVSPAESGTPATKRYRLLFAAAATVLTTAVLAALLIGQPAKAAPHPAAPDFHLASVSAPVAQVPVVADFPVLSDPPPPPPPPDPTQFVWPAHGSIWSPFGRRSSGFHTGDDIGAPRNSTIVAVRAGTVVFAGWESGYGNETRIDHGDGITTVYAHQAKIFVSVGDQVEQGQSIGLVGSTGRVTAPHLHFEVRVNNVAQDPMRWLRDARD